MKTNFFMAAYMT